MLSYWPIQDLDSATEIGQRSTNIVNTMANVVVQSRKCERVSGNGRAICESKLDSEAMQTEKHKRQASRKAANRTTSGYCIWQTVKSSLTFRGKVEETASYEEQSSDGATRD